VATASSRFWSVLLDLTAVGSRQSRSQIYPQETSPPCMCSVPTCNGTPALPLERSHACFYLTDKAALIRSLQEAPAFCCVCLHTEDLPDHPTSFSSQQWGHSSTGPPVPHTVQQHSCSTTPARVTRTSARARHSLCPSADANGGDAGFKGFAAVPTDPPLVSCLAARLLAAAATTPPSSRLPPPAHTTML